jgi:hypothetical protein
MSFLHSAFELQQKIDPLARIDPLSKVFFKNTDYSGPPPPPGAPNPNDAANAAQRQTDAMRLRRGMLANIFAGASSTQPVSGKTMLGT